MLIFQFVELSKQLHVDNFISFSVENHGTKYTCFENFIIRTSKTLRNMVECLKCS